MNQRIAKPRRSPRHRLLRRNAMLAAALAAAIPCSLQAATWNGGTGNWNLAANWTGGIPNSAAATALIDGGNAIASAVTLDISPSIFSLTVDANDSLTIGDNKTLILSGGATVNGVVTLASAGNFSVLRFTGAQSLDGTGQVVMGGSANANQIDGSGPLTIGSNITIRTGTHGGRITPTALTNQGHISAETANMTLTVDPTTLSNSGTLQVSAGTMNLNAAGWTNTGTINVSGGLLQLGGGYTTAGLNVSGWVRSGGAVDITGTLTNTGATLALGSNTGSFNLHGGTIKGGTITAINGAQFLLPNGFGGTVDGVTLDTDLTVGDNATLISTDGLTIAAGRTVTLSSAGNFSVLRFNGSQSLLGSGKIDLAGAANANQIDGSGPLMIGPGITVRTAGHGGRITPTALTNQGIISAETAAMTLTVDPTTLSNSGTMQVSLGTLNIAAAGWTNTGNIKVSGGLLQLGGNVTTTGLNLPGWVRSGGTVDITGTIDNTGTTLALATNTGSFNLHAGTIKGGTITGTGGAQLILPNGDSGTLDGVTLDIDLTVGDNATLISTNGLTIAAGRTVTLSSAGNFSVLRFNGSQSLLGSGKIDLAGTANPNQIDGSGPLTIGPGITVRTAGHGGRITPTALTNQGIISSETAGMTLTVDPTTLSNSGTMQVSLGTLNIAAAGWTNTGTIKVTGGLLQLGGAVTTPGLNLPGWVRTGGTVDITGTINNTGATLALNNTTGTFNLRSGTVKGGTITTAGTAQFLLPAGASGTLDGVTLDTDFVVNDNATATLVNGLTVANGRTITLTSGGNFSLLRFNGAQTLSGPGQVHFEGSVRFNQIDGSGPLTVGPDMTIKTSGQGARITPTSLTNQGHISAETALMTLTIDPTNLSNSGTMQVSAGTMNVNAASWTNTGTINVSGGLLQVGGSVTTAGLNLPGWLHSGGTVDITGNIINSSATLALAANTGTFNLHTGTVKGGTITTSGGAQFLVPNGASGTLDGVTLDTDMSVGDNATTIITNGLTISAGRTVTLASAGNFSILRFNGAQTLSGGGKVAFAGTSTFNQIDGSGPLTIAPDMIVYGHGGRITPTSLTNQGIISAQDTSQTLTVDPTTFINQGTLRAQAGGTLVLPKGVIGPGVVVAGPSGTVRTTFIMQDSISFLGTPGTPATYGRVQMLPKSQGGQTSIVKSLNFQLDAANKPVGTLDLADNAMIVDYTGASPLSTLRSYIINAYNSGAWTGAGISSSLAIASKGIAYAEASDFLGASGGTFVGQNADGTSVLLRSTFMGDANMDHSVNFSDLVTVAQNYGQTVSASTGSWWLRGDFNYDGIVNFADLVAVAQNYGGTLPAEPIPGAPLNFSSDLAAAFAEVPEPSSLALLFAACTFTRRSRRNKSRS